MIKLSAQSGYYGIRWKAAQTNDWCEPAKFPFMTHDEAAIQCARMNIQNPQMIYEVVPRGTEEQPPQQEREKNRIKSCQEEKIL